MVNQLKLYSMPPAEGEEEEPGMAEIVETSILTLGALLSPNVAAIKECVSRGICQIAVMQVLHQGNSKLLKQVDLPLGKHDFCLAGLSVT